jgi:hypothetical protein
VDDGFLPRERVEFATSKADGHAKKTSDAASSPNFEGTVTKRDCAVTSQRAC